MQLELNIETLVLHGLPAMDFDRFGAALEIELGHLFEQRGIPAALAASWQSAAMELDQIVLPRHAAPEAAAFLVAQNLYNGLSGASFAQVQSSGEVLG